MYRVHEGMYTNIPCGKDSRCSLSITRGPCRHGVIGPSESELLKPHSGPDSRRQLLGGRVAGGAVPVMSHGHRDESVGQLFFAEFFFV